MSIIIYEPKVGDDVMVYWGYGLGFRKNAIGKIEKLFEKSVRVELQQDVSSPNNNQKEPGWKRGFVLSGIPKNMFCQNWKKYANMVELISENKLPKCDGI